MSSNKENPTCGIYVITNIVSGKFYIGSTKDIIHRIRTHKSYLRRGAHFNVHLQRSYDKHGPEAFEYSIMELCEEDERIEVEQKYLDAYFDYDILYNLSPTAGTNAGRVVSQETKDKASKTRTGKKLNIPEETRRKMAERMSVPLTDEIKAKISAKRKGWKAPDELRARYSAMRKGVKLTPEQRASRAAKRIANKALRKQKELENGNNP